MSRLSQFIGYTPLRVMQGCNKSNEHYNVILFQWLAKHVWRDRCSSLSAHFSYHEAILQRRLTRSRTTIKTHAFFVGHLSNRCRSRMEWTWKRQGEEEPVVYVTDANTQPAERNQWQTQWWSEDTSHPKSTLFLIEVLNGLGSLNAFFSSMKKRKSQVKLSSWWQLNTLTSVGVVL